MSNSCKRPSGTSQTFPFPALGRLFEDLLGVDIQTVATNAQSAATQARGSSKVATIRPAMDLLEDDHAVTVQFELPGLTKDEVDVTLENGVLTVHGDKTLHRDRASKTFHRMERTFGTFHRAVKLPTGIQADKVEATFKNGVLTIVIPKNEAIKARKINIQ